MFDITSYFDFNSELSILLNSYNKLVWVLDRNNENIEIKMTLNPHDKVPVLLL
ncbi:hypothetical protein VCHA38O206_60142 [Vibrio chagasii]|nr:hypothetical protein VCHA28FP16_10746 [Vibrio chagasii]CAH6899256.1 hypothetical protein VCHA35P150_20366 [Vibrio chagasii]CAH7379181.1 hypothetical protein VCHA38O206_60142 [Vibrio chagasii]